MKPSPLDTSVFKLLVGTCKFRESRLVRPWWKPLQRYFQDRNRVVQLTIHNHSVLANFGYMYPMVARLYPDFNAPLLELVHVTRYLKGKPVRMVDVGAAIGDTILLVDANCAGMVSEYICIDGDPEFFGYLEPNLASLPNVRCILQQLSRAAGYNQNLVRTHPGTASAQGEDRVKTAPLEDVLHASKIGPIDVLKIDVDGFDGEVLAGSERILKVDRPGVIFEWHPILCRRTGNDPLVAFEVLRRNGYHYSAWFTKFGNFSHFAFLDDTRCLAAMAEFCISTTAYHDWHFDIVAFPDNEEDALRAVAELNFARHRSSLV